MRGKFGEIVGFARSISANRMKNGTKGIATLYCFQSQSCDGNLMLSANPVQATGKAKIHKSTIAAGLQFATKERKSQHSSPSSQWFTIAYENVFFLFLPFGHNKDKQFPRSQAMAFCLLIAYENHGQPNSIDRLEISNCSSQQKMKSNTRKCQQWWLCSPPLYNAAGAAF